MLSAFLAMTALAGLFGLLLGAAAIRLRVTGDPVVDRIDALLPQTQCGQCAYPGCRPYAEAIAEGVADIDQCPPGGETTIIALADLLARGRKPLNNTYGKSKPEMAAAIDEDACIGCALCIPACPVDAILGAPRQMHTVIEQQCTGCELCVSLCPVDCIAMQPVAEKPHAWRRPEPPGAAKHACIRCGECARVCPVRLLPQQLHWYARAKDMDRIEDYGLFDCIECGRCDDVCPSHIPLLQHFRYAAMQIRARQSATEQACSARRRYQQRQQRVQREELKQAARAARQRAAARAMSPGSPDPRRAAIAAAKQRARARRADLDKNPRPRA